MTLANSTLTNDKLVKVLFTQLVTASREEGNGEWGTGKENAECDIQYNKPFMYTTNFTFTFCNTITRNVLNNGQISCWKDGNIFHLFDWSTHPLHSLLLKSISSAYLVIYISLQQWRLFCNSQLFWKNVCNVFLEFLNILSSVFLDTAC